FPKQLVLLALQAGELVAEPRTLHPDHCHATGQHAQRREDQQVAKDTTRLHGAPKAHLSNPLVHSRSTARSFALRDLGFFAISASSGRIALFVSNLHSAAPQLHTGRPGGHRQGCASSAKARLTMRSSSEWKEMITALPPRASRSGIDRRNSASAPISSLAAMRKAWKVRVAGWMSRGQARRGIARSTTRA